MKSTAFSFDRRFCQMISDGTTARLRAPADSQTGMAEIAQA